ncbi:MAG: toll/interleukin-1 receptor domain-containing protein, partial [Steroidobacteraceae bacterium]
MNGSKKSVFVSYASQDAEAAARICEALRAASVDVWFDQSALRGGDAWDHRIRRQIRDCALFIPVVSKHTQERTEGYFRLEWRLADERTHLMGRTRTFILPVCVDETSESDADVPDSFVVAQWTRFPGGETSPAFCDRIATLLAGLDSVDKSRTKVNPTPSIGPTKLSSRWMMFKGAGPV